MRGGLGAVAQRRGPLCGATLEGAKSSFECWKMQHATLGTGWVLEADNMANMGGGLGAGGRQYGRRVGCWRQTI